MTDPDIIHRFVPARVPGKPPLLLLHRTGGNEDDLLEFGTEIGRGAALLSLRGWVLEEGKPRFFRRIGSGQFDRDDLALRTRELGDFITRTRQTYAIDAPVVVGFSNGANIAWSLLVTNPALIAGAILMRPMMPFEPAVSPLRDRPVLVISGTTDTIVPPDEAMALPALLRASGAQIVHEFVEAGHTLTLEDGALAAAWLERLG
jgi:phospholipase/carboxylesterase